MKTWYDIIAPHDDIKKGDFDESIFAADLADVASGTAPTDYSDPHRFFQKTYLTDGLKQLLVKVYKKLTQSKGKAVLELKTPFGGGKTHSLVTIYHYLKNGQKVKDFLPKEVEIIFPNIFVCVGTHLNPVSQKDSSGQKFRTLWGMLGYQLTGDEGYRFFAENDQKLVSPGKAQLRKFLEKQQPFVLLFDEILEYINRAVGVEENKNNLGAQTFAFFQELTEAVASLPKGMLIAALPSSVLEDYGEDRYNYLARLDMIFGRIKSTETPIKGEEIYSIVSRRLFANDIDEKGKEKVINKYFDLYQKEKENLPLKVRQADLKRKMELAYPFHPDVIDVLHEKWSTFHSFQKTRGALRLLANIVSDLYEKEENLDLILPGDIRLNIPGVRQEFLSHIGREYEGVIDSDIAGHQAKSCLLDKENRDWKHLAEKISTAIFFSSFCSEPSERGTTLPYIKLAVLREGVIPSLITEIIENELLKTLWYLEKKEDKYYFSDTPTLNKVLRDKRSALEKEKIEEEVEQVLKNHIGTKLQTYLWPEKSEDIPDNKSLKLVIVNLNDSFEKMDDFLNKKGESTRIYKNTLIFVFPDPDASAELQKIVQEYLALKEIKSEIQSGERPNLESKKDEIERHLHKIDQNFPYLVRNTYRIVKTGKRKINLGQPTVGVESLSSWIKKELENEEEIACQLSPQTIVKKFLSENNKVSTEKILDQFYKNISLPTISDESVLTSAIMTGVNSKSFGTVNINSDGDLNPDSLKYGQEYPREFPPAFSENELLVDPDLADEILKKRILAETGEEVETPFSEEELSQKEEVKSEEEGARKYKKLKLNIKNIPASKIADFNRGVLRLLASQIGEINFDAGINIEVEEEGISESTLEKVREALKALGVEFEEEKTE